MSIKATNWAWAQRDLKPAAKLVLMGLADRYNPDQGCFPSIARLAEDCNMSPRSVQDQLETLQQRGLIRVEKMPRNAGRLPLNRYRLAFEDDFEGQEKPADQPAKPAEKAPSAKSAYGKKAASPSAKSAAQLRQNLPTNPVREPKKNPRAEPARPVLGCIEVADDELSLSSWEGWLKAKGLPALSDVPALKRGTRRGGYMLPFRHPPSGQADVERTISYLQSLPLLSPSIAEKGRVG